MQYAIYPSKFVRITQSINGNYSHKGTFAIDEAGKDTSRDWLLAPCDIKVVRRTNLFVHFESVEKVKLANGTEDFINFRITHMNNTGGFFVGRTFKQLEPFYEEGNAGNATGNHVHIQTAIGKYKGLFKNVYGIYMLINEVNPTMVYSVLKGHNIILSSPLKWNEVLTTDYIVPVIQQVPTTLVAFMKYKGLDSSFSNRAKLAVKYGIVRFTKLYYGTVSQNTKLLEKLKEIYK